MKLQELLDSIGLQCGAGLVSRTKTFDTKAKEWRDTAFRWRVKLKLGDRQHEADYWCGRAHAKGMPRTMRTLADRLQAENATPIPPKSADVVQGLILDGHCKALDTYLRCQNHGKAMRYLLGKHFAAVQKAAAEGGPNGP